jgi:hypothetical protein
VECKSISFLLWGEPGRVAFWGFAVPVAKVLFEQPIIDGLFASRVGALVYAIFENELAGLGEGFADSG